MEERRHAIFRFDGNMVGITSRTWFKSPFGKRASTSPTALGGLVFFLDSANRDVQVFCAHYSQARESAKRPYRDICAEGTQSC